MGRELGEYGLQQYTEVKTVTVKLWKISLINFSFDLSQSLKLSLW
jgi:hypothetical protein